MHNEGNNIQGEKAAFRMGENNNKWKKLTKNSSPRYISISYSSIPEKRTTQSKSGSKN